MNAVAERTAVAQREKLAALAPLFRYPDEHYRVLCGTSRSESPELERFATAIARLSRPELEAAYTATFDLAPSCSPYLGVHLFGDDMRDRSRLMVGLRECGVGGLELPDHVAEVLAFAPHFSDEEWEDLVSFVLAPALAKMEECLRGSENPWRHLIAAAAALCRGGAS